jgi:hypothetical protein
MPILINSPDQFRIFPHKKIIKNFRLIQRRHDPAVALSEGLALICLKVDFPLNQPPTAAQEGDYEQRRILLEKTPRNLSSQGKPQSKNRYSLDQIGAPAKIGINAGVFGAGLDLDSRYGDFTVG